MVSPKMVNPRDKAGEQEEDHFGYLDIHLRSLLYEKSKTLVSIFSEILLDIWMKCTLLPQPTDLLKSLLTLFCTNCIQGRKLCCSDFIQYMFNMSCVRILVN